MMSALSCSISRRVSLIALSAESLEQPIPTSLSGWPPMAPPVQPARGRFGFTGLPPANWEIAETTPARSWLSKEPNAPWQSDMTAILIGVPVPVRGATAFWESVAAGSASRLTGGGRLAAAPAAAAAAAAIVAAAAAATSAAMQARAEPGTPLAANPSSRAFSPLSLPSTPLSLGSVLPETGGSVTSGLRGGSRSPVLTASPRLGGPRPRGDDRPRCHRPIGPSGETSTISRKTDRSRCGTGRR